MKRIEIYFSEDTELSEYEALNKGYRLDVYTKRDSRIYNLSVYTMIRLQQDFDWEYQEYGYFSVDPNLILVMESSKSEIIRTINRLDSGKYFENIKPTNVDISNYTRIQ